MHPSILRLILGIWEWRSSRKGEQMHMLTEACRSVTGSSWWLELAPEELEASVRLTRPTAAQRHAAISTIMSRNESCWITALFSYRSVNVNGMVDVY